MIPTSLRKYEIPAVHDAQNTAPNDNRAKSPPLVVNKINTAPTSDTHHNPLPNIAPDDKFDTIHRIMNGDIPELDISARPRKDDVPNPQSVPSAQSDVSQPRESRKSRVQYVEVPDTLSQEDIEFMKQLESSIVNHNRTRSDALHTAARIGYGPMAQLFFGPK